jgi:hypothetical protein
MENFFEPDNTIHSFPSIPVYVKSQHEPFYSAVLSSFFQDMLASIHKQRTFTFEQYEVMLSLQCGVDQSQKDRSGAQATDKDYSMYIIDLHGLEMEVQRNS